VAEWPDIQPAKYNLLPSYRLCEVAPSNRRRSWSKSFRWWNLTNYKGHACRKLGSPTYRNLARHEATKLKLL